MSCIAHIDTEKSWRGGEQQVYSLIEGLSKKGHRNIAFVRRGRPLAERLKALDCEIEEINPWGEYDLFSAAYAALRFKHHGVQLVHAHNAHGVALAALATLRDKIPFVLTRRVDFPVGANFFSWWKYNRATKIISISEAVSKVLMASGIPAHKIVKVPSGVDFRRYKDVTAITKQEMGISNDVIVIGQIAALAPHKDQATFLRAIKILYTENPQVRAVLVGNGPLEQELKKLSTSLGLDPIVQFVGFKEGALRWLKGFDIFCLSSKEEGLGTSVIDAMALGIPIVATNAGGIPELVEENISGQLVPAQNPQALASAFGQAIANPERLQGFVERARVRAKDFDVAKTVDQTEAVYRTILSPHKLSTDLST